ncbi:MAG: site-2 protease family protein [Chloroflexaceae bacterium]|nr:site-2 protease family protein [Chloroflexaceae bacterium]
MRWSYRVARIAGIDISIHITFLLIVLLFAVQWGSVHGIFGAFFGVALVLALFLCVLLHELGHSLAAQRLGIEVQQIMLLPLGGVALLSRTVTRPLHELLIALAGPLVNVLLAILIGAVLAATGNLLLLGSSAMVQGLNVALTWQTLLLWLFEANILLVVFNMIPALPLDGGRVLRSVLAMATNFRRATRIAAVLGQGIAIALGLYALLGGNFFLLLIAVFIFLGAGQEQAASQAGVVLSSHRVSDAYNKHVLTLTIGDRVSNVLDYILTSYQPDFAVLQENRLLGIITRDDVLQLLRAAPDNANVLDVYVTTVMRREVVRVDAEQTLDDALQVMGANNVRVVAVFDEEQYLGLLNRDDLSEAYTVLTFMDRLQRVPTA